MKLTFSKEHMVLLEDITYRWQRKEHITGTESKLFAAMLSSVTEMRWLVHFNGCRSDWGSSNNVKENLIIVLLDYIGTRKSIRVLSPRLCCHLDTPAKYKTLAASLYEYRRQFPRIVSMLIALESGVQVLTSWQGEAYNYYQLVHTPEHSELHKAMCIMRLLAKEQGVLLYSNHRYTLLSECFVRLVTDTRKSPTPLTLDMLRDSGGKGYTQAMYRRATMVYAASDILAVRAQVKYLTNKQYR
jgi:hypothetical protein